MSKTFETHPQTPDRVSKSQEEISTVLPPRPEYMLDTSEFEDVKARLAAIENRHKVDNSKDTNRPTLRRADQGNGTSGNGKGSDTGDDRPTLKRRPDDTPQ